MEIKLLIMGTTHSGAASWSGTGTEASSTTRSQHWPFNGHEKRSKENNTPQAKQQNKSEEDSNVMTVQKFNVDDEEYDDGPSMIFQKVNNNFSDKAEPKIHNPTTSIDTNKIESKAAKEESKPLSRMHLIVYFSIYIHVVIPFFLFSSSVSLASSKYFRGTSF